MFSIWLCLTAIYIKTKACVYIPYTNLQFLTDLNKTLYTQVLQPVQNCWLFYKFLRPLFVQTSTAGCCCGTEYFDIVINKTNYNFINWKLYNSQILTGIFLTRAQFTNYTIYICTWIKFRYIYVYIQNSIFKQYLLSVSSMFHL